MHVVATAGHVDHGKSTLLRAITGQEPDRWEEERARGLTIDLGFVWTDLDHRGQALTVAFVDVPGHERFIANMLAGTGAVRLALFVVAADDGWSAQSQEHLDILDLLGVGAAVAAVTKVDVAGEERARVVAADVERRLAATTLAGAPVLLTDAVTGRGIDEVTAALAERLAAAPRPEDPRRTRLWVDRSFTIGGAGTVVTGTLGAGALAVGDGVAVLPAGRSTRIRALQMLGAPVERCVGPARVAVNLAGVDRNEVGRGDALVTGATDPASAWVVTATVDAWVRALPRHEVGPRGAWHLHVGSAETTCTVHPVLHEAVRGDAPGHVRLVLDRALPLQTGDRFVLREAGRRATVAGGEVLDPAPTARVRGVDQRLERATALDAVRTAGDRLPALVRADGGARRAPTALAAAGRRPDAAPPPGLTRIAGWLVEDDALARWRAAVRQEVASHHERAPTQPGPGRDTLAAAARAAGCRFGDLADALPDHLATEGVLHRRGPGYALAEHVPAVDDAAAARRATFLALLDREPLAPPRLEDAAREAGLSHPEVQRIVQSGEVVRCGAFAFSGSAVDRAVARLRDLHAEVGPFTAAQAKEAWGVSRRHAIPLLEHLDAAGVTVFDGQHRRLRPS